MKPKKQITGLAPYNPGKPIEEVKREFNLTRVIKLASNENPFGPSPKVKQAIAEACHNLAQYPDGAAFELRRALAEFYQVHPDQLLFGNGSDEIVQIICRTFLTPDSNAVMAEPTFPRYKANVIIEGAQAVEVPLQNGVHNLEAMAEAVNQQTRLVWICNPNNPTGTYVNEEALTSFLRRVPQDVLVVVDEAYYEYVTEDDYPDTVAMLKQYPNIIILRTFSKIYGLAALRIGYAIARQEVIDLLNRVREPFNTSRVAQQAALAALSDQDYVAHCYEQNKQGKEYYYRHFQSLNLACYPTEANFIMVDLGRPAHPVFEAMLRQGVIVRSGKMLGMPTCLRITIGSQEQNETIIQLLTHMVQNVS
ncbi:Histidinol-phosphate aminotransferase [Caldalkalibacillus thermarum TA2.A1]|uniref:Histidinol-phosphate aminotransferase n=1 Tax=Caldalkalibacillus thermarum (strain TA2.A1) TaxID=986075 RepID=F5L734_CALTT|nr:histidinol-phosphate transaminase [Caldalkalibacillus thermarum]EGL82869.1 Histidinol-phosphate aminotransferase [Caldalkalibacillus thermarum TA2.A1]QZT32722.1 histidinol-phosphate transaminase [Caldalkalibacillus thermarum TA2.A1]